MPEARRAAALNLRKWREGLGWSQRALAERARVSQKTVSNLEDEDAHSPKLISVSQVCKALGVEPFTALVPGSSAAPETSALLAALVASFMQCDEAGKAHITQAALREAEYARSRGPQAQVEMPLVSDLAQ